MDIFKTWENKLEQLHLVYTKIGADELEFSKQPPAIMVEIEKLEETIKCSIPISLKDTLLNFSKELKFYAHLPNDFKLPLELKRIFSAGFEISLTEIENAENLRKKWIQKCYMNIDDDYDKVWHNKLGFMRVGDGDGDVIALDLNDENEDKRVVYLSHDGCTQTHGMVLGRNFKEYFSNLILIGACGNENWQMEPFIDSSNGINPNCENANKYRNLINLVW